MNKWTARKQAQRAVKATACEVCGSTDRLQRHHPNLSRPLEVTVLCQACHASLHIKEGTWGQGPRETALCVICGKTFLPSDSHLHKTCGAACLAELGRRNALKRWHPIGGQDGKTECHESQPE